MKHTTRKVCTMLHSIALLCGLCFSGITKAQAQKRYTDYYANGQLREEGFIDTIDDCKVGEWRRYYKTGRTYEITHYKNGQLEGEMISYFESGKPFFHGFYTAGVLHGQQLTYYDKCNAKGTPYLYKRECYRHGQRDGMQYTYNGKGKLSYSGRYVNGQCIADTTYAVDGIYYTALRQLDPTDDSSEAQTTIDEKFIPYSALYASQNPAKGKKKTVNKHGSLHTKSPKAPQQPVQKPKHMKVNPDGTVIMQ